jgi:hypothetical protein
MTPHGPRGHNSCLHLRGPPLLWTTGAFSRSRRRVARGPPIGVCRREPNRDINQRSSRRSRGGMHVALDLYERIVELCGWPKNGKGARDALKGGEDDVDRGVTGVLKSEKSVPNRPHTTV